MKSVLIKIFILSSILSLSVLAPHAFAAKKSNKNHCVAAVTPREDTSIDGRRPRSAQNNAARLWDINNGSENQRGTPDGETGRNTGSYSDTGSGNGRDTSF